VDSRQDCNGKRGGHGFEVVAGKTPTGTRQPALHVRPAENPGALLLKKFSLSSTPIIAVVRELCAARM
jgi:hypothetical protein